MATGQNGKIKIRIKWERAKTDGRKVRVVERNLTERDRIVSDTDRVGVGRPGDKQGQHGPMQGLTFWRGTKFAKSPNSVEDIDAHRVFGYALVKDGRNT
nr:hypothetical protein [Tanacetum cinerariifolium]